ncbi:Putative transposase of IS4/5 family protein [Phaeobacter gallaeciensis]|nr:Putative transposase of IS4/5 family protein [Phaeobacter gallaeciensis]ATF23870.1 Putative transposase of IS4/5 family protein [Phaeobacter gallaeciensis]
MSDLFWLADAQMARLRPFIPKSNDRPRTDDRRVPNGIIFINHNDLRWCDAPKEYGLHKTLSNRWKHWSAKRICAKVMMGLAADHGGEKIVVIDATYLKAHRSPAADWSSVGPTQTEPVQP